MLAVDLSSSAFTTTSNFLTKLPGLYISVQKVVQYTGPIFGGFLVPDLLLFMFCGGMRSSLSDFSNTKSIPFLHLLLVTSDAMFGGGTVSAADIGSARENDSFDTHP